MSYSRVNLLLNLPKTARLTRSLYSKLILPFLEIPLSGDYYIPVGHNKRQQYTTKHNIFKKDFWTGLRIFNNLENEAVMMAQGPSQVASEEILNCISATP